MSDLTKAKDTLLEGIKELELAKHLIEEKLIIAYQKIDEAMKMICMKEVEQSLKEENFGRKEE